MMIVLDTNVLLMDICYPNDANFAVNRNFLNTLATVNEECGMTTQGLFELTGIRSFNTPAANIELLPTALAVRYRLTVIPSLATSHYAGVTNDEVVGKWLSECRWAMP